MVNSVVNGLPFAGSCEPSADGDDTDYRDGKGWGCGCYVYRDSSLSTGLHTFYGRGANPKFPQ